jgi:hypothetical protein
VKFNAKCIFVEWFRSFPPATFIEDLKDGEQCVVRIREIRDAQFNGINIMYFRRQRQLKISLNNDYINYICVRKLLISFVPMLFDNIYSSEDIKMKLKDASSDMNPYISFVLAAEIPKDFFEKIHISENSRCVSRMSIGSVWIKATHLEPPRCYIPVDKTVIDDYGLCYSDYEKLIGKPFVVLVNRKNFKIEYLERN